MGDQHVPVLRVTRHRNLCTRSHLDSRKQPLHWPSWLVCSPSLLLYHHLRVIQFSNPPPSPPFSIFPLSLPHNSYSPCGNANGSKLASPFLSSFHPTPACSIVYTGFKLICKRQTGGRLKQRQTEGKSPKKKVKILHEFEV